MQIETLGQRLKRLRTAQRLSQAELGERSGTSKSTISAIERGITPRPTAETLKRLGDVLGVSVEYLLEGAERDAMPEILTLAPSIHPSWQGPLPASKLEIARRRLAEVMRYLEELERPAPPERGR